ncbi:ABC transporter ATP-binding protein [Streptomyces sp. 7-21]|nr:ABC transporter ATP-binding protein [Streptomyces sp. 7-21]MBL1068816.1 ABC transporter ATP-binding protein [Streptomyces sp. 7-21]
MSLQGSGPMVSVIGAPENSLTKQRLTPGTIGRVLRYARPHRRLLIFLLFTTVIGSFVVVAIPLILREIIDDGVMRGDKGLVVSMALLVAGLALVDGLTQLGQAYFSARIGQELTYDLRVKAFAHVQKQPLAFFTRTQTGSLVSRLNADVMAAQQALGTVLMSLSSVFTLVLVLTEMFYLSWVLSSLSLVVLPLLAIPSVVIGRRVQRYSRQQMQVNAELAGTINERFNVGGAILAKLFGRPREEAETFARGAGRVRDIGVRWAVYNRLLFILMTLLATLVTALVYGLGGTMVIDDSFQIGTLVALAALLGRLYAPITQLASVQGHALTALVSFDRVFEILDLKPLIQEKPNAVPLPARADGSAPAIEFDGVAFRYPKPSDVSLPSLEAIKRAAGERTQDPPYVLTDISFLASAGKLTALVGPSGAGKTTITHLITRLYDPTAGSVRIDGHDLRDVTLESLRGTIGVVTQDAHLFHDTIRGNLTYARPEASDEELIEACRAAQIWDLIESLPSGLDTVVGDRGFRLSGGEKQRLAVARLLLKKPSVVVLDEATAHLDSESEAAIQQALSAALAGRTSVVIAHRLSTIREADQILVIDGGTVRERGTHEELLAHDGLYAELYRTQFAPQEPPAGEGTPRRPDPGGATDGLPRQGGIVPVARHGTDR